MMEDLLSSQSCDSGGDDYVPPKKRRTTPKTQKGQNGDPAKIRISNIKKNSYNGKTDLNAPGVSGLDESAAENASSSNAEDFGSAEDVGPEYVTILSTREERIDAAALNRIQEFDPIELGDRGIDEIEDAMLENFEKFKFDANECFNDIDEVDASEGELEDFCFSAPLPECSYELWHVVIPWLKSTTEAHRFILNNGDLDKLKLLKFFFGGLGRIYARFRKQNRPDIKKFGAAVFDEESHKTAYKEEQLKINMSDFESFDLTFNPYTPSIESWNTESECDMLVSVADQAPDSWAWCPLLSRWHRVFQDECDYDNPRKPHGHMILSYPHPLTNTHNWQAGLRALGIKCYVTVSNGKTTKLQARKGIESYLTNLKRVTLEKKTLDLLPACTKTFQFLASTVNTQLSQMPRIMRTTADEDMVFGFLDRYEIYNPDDRISTMHQFLRILTDKCEEWNKMERFESRRRFFDFVAYFQMRKWARLHSSEDFKNLVFNRLVAELSEFAEWQIPEWVEHGLKNLKCVCRESRAKVSGRPEKNVWDHGLTSGNKRNKPVTMHQNYKRTMKYKTVKEPHNRFFENTACQILLVLTDLQVAHRQKNYWAFGDSGNTGKTWVIIHLTGIFPTRYTHLKIFHAANTPQGMTGMKSHGMYAYIILNDLGITTLSGAIVKELTEGGMARIDVKNDVVESQKQPPICYISSNDFEKDLNHVRSRWLPDDYVKFASEKQGRTYPRAKTECIVPDYMRCPHTACPNCACRSQLWSAQCALAGRFDFTTDEIHVDSDDDNDYIAPNANIAKWIWTHASEKTKRLHHEKTHGPEYIPELESKISVTDSDRDLLLKWSILEGDQKNLLVRILNTSVGSKIAESSASSKSTAASMDSQAELQTIGRSTQNRIAQDVIKKYRLSQGPEV
jgi:hypothetical protein